MEKLICLVFYLELPSQADNITALGTLKRYCPVISPQYCSVTLRARCSDQHFPFSFSLLLLLSQTWDLQPWLMPR